MPDREDDLLAGLGGPRPLPPGLRQRLEHALQPGASDEELALGDDLSSRLEDALTDPLAAVLAGIDGPRPLPDATRARLEQRLRRRAGPPRWIGAAAAMVVVAGGVSAGLLSSSRGAPPTALHAERATPSTTSTSLGTRTQDEAGSAGSAVNVPAAAQGATPGSVQATPTGGVVKPQVAAVVPASGPTTGAIWVTVTGSGFAGARTVTFGGRPAVAFVVVSGTEIRAEAPPHPAGTVDVQVTSPSGTSPLVAADRFTYLARP